MKKCVKGSLLSDTPSSSRLRYKVPDRFSQDRRPSLWNSYTLVRGWSAEDYGAFCTVGEAKEIQWSGIIGNPENRGN